VVFAQTGAWTPAAPIPPERADSASNGPRLLACRVDALVLAFKLELTSAVRDELNERQAVADEAGRAALHLGSSTFELKRSRARDLVSFRNADLRGTYDPMATGVWVLEVVAHAAYLMAHPLADAIGLLERSASEFGRVTETRLRRFDLCADYVGFAFHDDDARLRVLTTRAKSGLFVSDPKDVDEAAGLLCRSDVREHRGAMRNVTGLVVAAGNPLMARIYDKTAELSLSGREHKRELEHAIWRPRGWDGHAPVARVEFQHRGRVLDEMRLRDVHALPSKLDAVWQFDTGWLRLIEPGTATRRTRCDLDPRWRAVTGTVFEHASEPIPRLRLRGDGAQPSHVRGAALSMLGARGRISLASVNDDGEELSEATLVDALTPAEQEACVVRYYESLGFESGRIIANDELGRHGARGALVRVIAQNDATRARFSSAGDPSGNSNGR
jgi:hypothetical protein